jgi:hypothetical protein
MSDRILPDAPLTYPWAGREYRGELLEVYASRPSERHRNGYPILRFASSVEQTIEGKSGTREPTVEGVVEPGGEVKLPCWHPHLRNQLLRAYKQAREDGVELLGREFVARFDELAPGGARWTLEVDGIDIPPAFEERQAPWAAWAAESEPAGFDRQAALERLEATGIRPADEEPIAERLAENAAAVDAKRAGAGRIEAEHLGTRVVKPKFLEERESAGEETE